MDISLGTIDWTAISAITSFLMTVAAFATIYSSVRQNKKSRELQIKLLRQQQAQQKLDDMIANIMTICHNMNPFHIFEYSSTVWVVLDFHLYRKSVKIRRRSVCVEEKKKRSGTGLLFKGRNFLNGKIRMI